MRHIKKAHLITLCILLCVSVSGFLILLLHENANKGNQERGDPGNIGKLPTLEWEGKTLTQRQDVRTLLLIGVDATAETERLASISGGQADFLVLLVFDEKAKQVKQLHIDRDTMTYVRVKSLLGETSSRSNMQICLSHAYGKNEQECCENTIDAVQQIFPNIKIDGYISVNRDQIGIINDILGGITVTFEDDDLLPLDPAMRAGTTLRLNAKQAELLARARMSVSDGTNVSRMRRQEVLIRGLIKTIHDDIGNEGTGANDLFLKLEHCITTNQSRGWYVNLANRVYKWNVSEAETLSGEHTIGEDGFVEFHQDDGEVTRWMAETLYE